MLIITRIRQNLQVNFKFNFLFHLRTLEIGITFLYTNGFIFLILKCKMTEYFTNHNFAVGGKIAIVLVVPLDLEWLFCPDENFIAKPMR